MQLKLRIGVGDTLTLDVQPGDTFQDLSDRVFQISGIQVDLSQLKSDDQPFDMTTNVIQYFAPKLEKESEKQKTPKLCRLCSRAITHDPHYLFERPSHGISLAEKVNTSLPIHVTIKDQLPKQICTICFKGLNTNYEFMKKVMNAQKSLENVYSVKSKNSPTSECCPLCMTGRFKTIDTKNGSVNNSIKKEPVKKEVTLPQPKILPKVEMGEVFSIKEEFFQDDEVVTDYWDGTIPNNTVEYHHLPTERRYRKRMKTEDDSEWTIDEEYLPVSRRGRPKGAKNKPKNTPVAIVDKSCVLCGWLGPETDMLHHALNQHCQPDMAYFPCPLCKVNQPNEMVLETHLVRHSNPSNVSSYPT